MKALVVYLLENGSSLLAWRSLTAIRISFPERYRRSCDAVMSPQPCPRKMPSPDGKPPVTFRVHIYEKTADTIKPMQYSVLTISDAMGLYSMYKSYITLYLSLQTKHHTQHNYQ